MTRPPVRLLVRVSAVVLVAAALCGVSAASLGINVGSLDAWVLPAAIEPPPPPPAPPSGPCTFDGSNGSLDGQPAAPCATGTWSSNGGNWHTVGGRLKGNAQTGIALVDAGSSDVTTQVDVFGVDKKNRSGGLVVSYDTATGSYLAAVLVGPNQVELRAVGPGGITSLGTASLTISSPTRIGFSRTAAGLTVYVNGSLIAFDGETTVPAPDGFTGTSAGLFHDGGPAVEFDNYALTAL